MKFTAIVGLTVIGYVSAAPSTKCLSCKLQDSESSFLYSYSYCKDTDQCLQDEWNYIN